MTIDLGAVDGEQFLAVDAIFRFQHPETGVSGSIS
jgi:hypothetical protein